MIMAKEKKKHAALGKATKGFAIAASILVMIPCLAVAVFGVLDIAGVFPLLDEPRYYTVQFIVDEVIIEEKQVKRGEYVEYDYKPSKPEFEFKGWDYDGNKIPDRVKRRVYSDYYFRAVWKDLRKSSTSSSSTGIKWPWGK